MHQKINPSLTLRGGGARAPVPPPLAAAPVGGVEQKITLYHGGGI